MLRAWFGCLSAKISPSLKKKHCWGQRQGKYLAHNKKVGVTSGWKRFLAFQSLPTNGALPTPLWTIVSRVSCSQSCHRPEHKLLCLPALVSPFWGHQRAMDPWTCSTQGWDWRPTAPHSALTQAGVSSTFHFFYQRFEQLCSTSTNNSLDPAGGKWQNSLSLHRERCWSTRFYFFTFCQVQQEHWEYPLICVSPRAARLRAGKESAAVSHCKVVEAGNDASLKHRPLQLWSCSLCSSHRFKWIPKCSSSARPGLLVLVSWLK